MRDALSKVIAVAIVLAITVAIFWIHAHIPCSWFQFHKAGEIPARCLTNFKH